MGAFTEKSLNKFSKQKLLAMYLKVTKKIEYLNDHLLEEAQHFRDMFKDMEFENFVVENVNYLLSKRLVDMKRKC